MRPYAERYEQNEREGRESSVKCQVSREGLKVRRQKAVISNQWTVVGDRTRPRSEAREDPVDYGLDSELVLRPSTLSRCLHRLLQQNMQVVNGIRLIPAALPTLYINDL